jgi:hypothetical protein
VYTCGWLSLKEPTTQSDQVMITETTTCLDQLLKLMIATSTHDETKTVQHQRLGDSARPIGHPKAALLDQEHQFRFAS